MLPKKILNDSGTITTAEYAAAQYKNGVLEFIGQPEGYIEPSNAGYQYVYQFTDHLGNIRLSYSDKDGNGTITTDEIVEESNYYPFGLQQKGYNSTVNGRSHQYKYNNTELEEGLGLNWYEMPLRSYDPTIARWNRQDPVVHHGLSTYNAFDNNPIYYADPSGADSASPWNRDNRENTLDSGARGSFGFSSVVGSTGGARYNSYTGQYEDRLGRAVSYSDALASLGLKDNNRNSGLSGLAMLNAALAPYGLSASANTNKKEKWEAIVEDTYQEFGEEWGNWDNIDCCGDTVSGALKGVGDGLIDLTVTFNPFLLTADVVTQGFTGKELFPGMEVSQEETGGYFAGIFLFALLEPSPGGEMNGIKSIIAKITKKHGLFKCVQCADEVVRALKSKGIRGEILEVTTNGNRGMAANIWSDLMQTNISTNGRHRAVMINDMVFDNVHKNGIKYSEWVKDLFSPTGYKITKTPF
ncbi:papain fold toxin domain-containing protein [Aquimarina mytili]|uniref:Tox-PL-2 domain-containing protein n=1 Tax=Aquimarina mytili TaxID=874423 RepID=A0A937D8J0_9FLAO|nr:papain fold toxin domain-containing protein [Aquimarina mytili]MBL0684115.1 hypothetical protein [Aquimarina mytili]